mmetsp:Transcript_8907/g.30600  ORF Transcript_8907/g.30600 Transcript_8907/m.30600 type:complete len:264 (-) Transcript_8907:2216-3007(-)
MDPALWSDAKRWWCTLCRNCLLSSECKSKDGGSCDTSVSLWTWVSISTTGSVRTLKLRCGMLILVLVSVSPCFNVFASPSGAFVATWWWCPGAILGDSRSPTPTGHSLAPPMLPPYPSSSPAMEEMEEAELALSSAFLVFIAILFSLTKYFRSMWISCSSSRIFPRMTSASLATLLEISTITSPIEGLSSADVVSIRPTRPLSSSEYQGTSSRDVISGSNFPSTIFCAMLKMFEAANGGLSSITLYNMQPSDQTSALSVYTWC